VMWAVQVFWLPVGVCVLFSLLAIKLGTRAVKIVACDI
jgi:hypothetical protein